MSHDREQILIREETHQDWLNISALVEAAFGQANEAQLVRAIRDSENFVPQLSLVAVRANRIVGHILLSKMRIVGDDDSIHDCLSLAPLSVLPAFQNKGIGSQLCTSAIEVARTLGFDLIIVLGDPQYYSRFGFVPASRFSITAPWDVPDEAFMLLWLNEPQQWSGGKALYPPAFDTVE